MKIHKTIQYIALTMFCCTVIVQISAQDGMISPDQFEAVKYPDAQTPCLDEVPREILRKRIAKAKRDMIEDGLLERLFPAAQRSQPPSLIWPMRQADGFNDPSYYAISNYVDLDSTSGILDYNGLSQSYDGHNGVDIRTYPYWWKKMDDSHVEAIAAADGVIILKQDGNNDQSCTSGGTWNAVFVMHPDGSITWYGHLKTNSTTDKDSGDMVVAGEYLGIIGSSGSSTNPHLHLECYDDMGNLVEPFAGPSNNTTNVSWWQNQLPYYDSGINKIATHTTAPVFPACPGIETTNENDVFDPGEAITFSIAIRHSLTVDSAKLELFEPDGDQSTLLDLTWNRTGTFFLRNTMAWWNRTLPGDAEIGKWTYRVTYYTQTYGVNVYDHDFWVTGPCEANFNFMFPHVVDRYYEASNTISSTSELIGSTHIVYDAENITTLSPGFHAPQGSRLEVKTNGCQ